VAAADADFDGWSEAVAGRAVERAARLSRELLAAVRAAERRAEYSADDPRVMGHWVAGEWQRQIAAGHVSAQAARELIEDLGRIETWKQAPGALVMFRLKTAYESSTGEAWKRRPR
jgi:hypothetical protein